MTPNTADPKLEPCPLNHHVSAGLKAHKRGVDPRITCLDCGLTLAAPDWTTVYERWNTRSRATVAAPRHLKPMCDDPECWVCNRVAELHAASSEYGWSANLPAAAPVTPEQCPATCADFSMYLCAQPHRCVLDAGHPFDPLRGDGVHEFETHQTTVRPRAASTPVVEHERVQLLRMCLQQFEFMYGKGKRGWDAVFLMERLRDVIASNNDEVKEQHVN